LKVHHPHFPIVGTNGCVRCLPDQKWNPAGRRAAGPPKPPDENALAMKVTVQSKTGIAEFEGDSSENLLYAGLKQGLGLPYECATGTCGTCRARVMEGEVTIAWDQAPGLGLR
jgi:hypothetical protein